MHVCGLAFRQARRGGYLVASTHLDDGGQHPLCVVHSQRAVDLRQALRAGPRQHTQAHVHLHTGTVHTHVDDCHVLWFGRRRA